MVSYSSIVDEVLSSKSSSTDHHETIHQELHHLVQHRYQHSHHHSKIIQQNIPRDYIQYLIVWVMAHTHGIQTSPPLHVDVMWHLHLLETKSYRYLESIIINKLKEEFNKKRDGNKKGVVEVISINHIDHSALNTDGRKERLERTEKFYSTLGLDFTNYEDGNNNDDDIQVKVECTNVIPEEVTSSSSRNDNDDDDAARKRRRVEGNTNTNSTTNHVSPTPPNQSSQQTEIITLKVKDQSGEETFFQVRKSTIMNKIFKAYARRIGVQPRSLRFLFKCNRIQEDQTPEHWQMKNNDQIDCSLVQIGC